MKIKEVQKTVHLAWSPKSHYPLQLVAGTAAQQLDASFNTSAAVELYNVNLDDPSLDLELQCAFKSEYRFHKLIWSDYESGKVVPKGNRSIIVGGCDDGKLLIYDAAELLKNKVIDYERSPRKGEGLVVCLDRHKGPVRAMEFNPSKGNLLATGASESEIFIWDLDSELNPMTPGSPIQPLDEVISLSWNKKSPAIMATTSSTRCVVWDLGKNQAVIKLSDSTSKIRWKDVKWNPKEPLQLCLASEDDRYSVIQMWDLRYATSPIKTFEGHQKGVLSLAWCSEDPDLLISCGKDNKLIVWNPNAASPTGEIVDEISLNTEWNFEVNWCPRNPFLISTSSCAGISSIFTLADGVPSSRTNDALADSFPGINQYHQPAPSSFQLSKAPKWMKRSAGASFAFGGKLITFVNPKDEDVEKVAQKKADPEKVVTEKGVYVSQVITEKDLDQKFKELDNVIEQGHGYAHCLKKAESANDPYVRNAWNFIAGQFTGANFKNQIYHFLGTSQSSLQEKLSNLNITDDTKNDDSINDGYSNISRIGPADGDDIFGNIAAQHNAVMNSKTATKPPLKIIQTNDIEGTISDALLLGNIELAVNLCLKEGRMADAIILAMSGGPELLAKAQSKYFEKSDDHLTTLISAVVTEDWRYIVETCDLSNWKQVLVALLTYTREDEFPDLCELLGLRLSTEGNEVLKKEALICYICAGNINQLIENWKPTKTGSATEIQELAELGLLMKEAIKTRTGVDMPVTGAMANVLQRYAELLSSQGCLKQAYNYLGDSQEENIQMLKDRLMYALGLKTIRSEVGYAKSTGYFQPQQPHQTQYPNQYGGGYAGYNNAPKSVVKPYNPVNQTPSMLPATNKPPVFAPTKPSIVPPPASIPSHGSGDSHVPGHNVFPPQTIPPPAAYGSGPPSGISKHPPAPNLFPPQATGVPPQSSLFNPQPTPAMFTPSMGPPSGPPGGVFNPPSNLPHNLHNAGVPGPAPLGRATPTPPPPSSQVSYNGARQTPDHVTQGRPKYIIDPSVHGGGPHRNSFSNSYPAPNQQQVNSFPYGTQNESSFYQMQNQNSFYQAPQQNPNPYIPNSQIQTPQLPQKPVQPEIPKMQPVHQSAPGWNDPPSLAFEKPVPNQVGYVTPTPITHPLYGSAIPEENILNNAPPSSNAPMQPPGGYPLPNTYRNEAYPNQPGMPPTQAHENIPKPKPSLPEQHIHLQTVLDELRNQCYNKTTNQQMKRKLDDVARKLEMLYDAIRESRLSQSTLQGLHEIVNAIQHGNFPECLSIHTRLVSGPDFSTIASFMPGVKVLVQSAMQLGVYL